MGGADELKQGMTLVDAGQGWSERPTRARARDRSWTEGAGPHRWAPGPRAPESVRADNNEGGINLANAVAWDGQTLIGDKHGVCGSHAEATLADTRVTQLGPARKGEPEPACARLLKPLR